MNDTLTFRRVDKVQPNTREYWSAHWWIAHNYGYPKTCENTNTTCKGISKKYHWANLSGECKRVRSDWKRLCVSCHRLLDYDNKCKRGHKLAEDNLYIAPKTGARGCKICRAMTSKKWKKENQF